jgi:hypothetical protein
VYENPIAFFSQSQSFSFQPQEAGAAKAERLKAGA